MNRREFLKGGLAGAFGMFLTWAGVVKAEEAVVEDVAPYADFHAKLDDLARRVIETREQSMTIYAEEWVCGPPIPHMLDRQVAKAEAIKLDREIVGIEERGGVSDWCDKCACRPECEAGHGFLCTDNRVDWSYGADTGGASTPAVADGYMDAIDAGEGRWVHWANDGSDENGTGTYDDPVATEACAQAIASNPLFRV